MRALLDRHIGADWIEHAADPERWSAVDDIQDAGELRAVRREQRAALVDVIRTRIPRDRLGRGEDRAFVQAAAQAFDPDVLTIGFARRVATYKRLGLMVYDAERALTLLTRRAAGAARHRRQGPPQGRPGQAADPAPAGAARHAGHRAPGHVPGRLRPRESAARLSLQGCDVWVNLPRPPMEASGTSGMKSVLNGGLQLSVLDGWWAEAYDGTNGWALSGDVDADETQPRTRATPRSCTACWRPRSCPASTRLHGKWTRPDPSVAAHPRADVLGHAHAHRLRGADVRLAGAA